jgi:hypothetical protein
MTDVITARRLEKLVANVIEIRAELRRQGASAAAFSTATERTVRDAWEPLVPPMHEWPPYLVFGQCAYCDGTGLVLSFGVINRLGIAVTEGRPCRCPRGARFEPKPPAADTDHTAAGKTPKQKPLSRFGR